jgi:hypothetical protein
MLDILKFYVSGFWTWAGLTIGLSLLACGIGNAGLFVSSVIHEIRRG